MSTGLENYDGWKCSPPFNPDEREAEEPCEACEREVEALEIELSALRQHSELSRLVDEVGKRAPGSWSVTVNRGHYVERYGTIDRTQYSISWWPTERGPARYIEARTADEALSLFRTALTEARS